MSKANETFDISNISRAGNAGDRDDAFANAIRNRLLILGVTGQPSFLIHSLSPNVKRRILALREIQIQHDEWEEEYLAERAALEAKYQKLYQPLYAKRYEIVTGAVKVGGITTETVVADQEEDKGVPAFWLIAMKNNQVLAEEIAKRDEEALKFLKDIKWSRVDSESFKIEFFFDSNPYFKNSVLTKTYHVIDEDVVEKTSGSVIEWFPGKSLTEKTTRKKPIKAGSKNAKPVSEIEECSSFFNFFIPLEEPKDKGNFDDDAAEELKYLMERDYEVGATIRDKIIPHAVYWFTGEAIEDEFSADDSEDEYEDEYEDDDQYYNDYKDEENDDDDKTQKKI